MQRNGGSSRFEMHSRFPPSADGCRYLERAVNTTRILFLRTFRSDDLEKMVIARVASALLRNSDELPIGQLVVIGDEAARAGLCEFWTQTDGSKDEFCDAIDYVSATDDSWKEVVHREIARCGCVILFLSPKDASFPRSELPDANVLLTPGGYDEFYHQPLKEDATGRGLLQEVAFLERMGRVENTILLSHEAHRQEILQIIEHSYFAMYGDTMIFGMGGMRAVHPRKTALEKKLGVLHDLPNFVSFNENDLRQIQAGSSFARLASIAESLIAKRDQGADSDVIARDLPIALRKPTEITTRLGRKDHFAMAGGGLSVHSTGNITEFPRERICAVLSDEVVARGCPYCCSSLENVFFYSYGLVPEHPETFSEGYVRGKCQACGRRCTHAYNMLSDQ